MKEQILELFTILGKWEAMNVRILSNGTKQICHVPHVAPEAWLHLIYAGLSQEEIRNLQAKLSVELPSQYKEFLGRCNGINIFSNSLSIWGARKSYSRLGDDAVQPFSIIDLNTERPSGCPDSWLFFGSYSWDGSRMVLDLNDGSEKVYRVKRRSTKILQEWVDFDTWILEEAIRLSSLFDERGIEYDESIPTVPNI